MQAEQAEYERAAALRADNSAELGVFCTVTGQHQNEGITSGLLIMSHSCFSRVLWGCWAEDQDSRHF